MPRRQRAKVFGDRLPVDRFSQAFHEIDLLPAEPPQLVRGPFDIGGAG
jgi:hypothetical protein